MRTQLRKIGNSRGIIIPAAFLEACGFAEEVELSLEGKAIIVKPLKELRQGWFDNYQANHDEDVWEDLPIDDGIKDWEW